jgi:hypothetical protein
MTVSTASAAGSRGEAAGDAAAVWGEADCGERRDELLGEGVGVGLVAAASRPVDALVVGLAVAKRQVGQLVSKGEALQRDRALKAVDEDEGADGGGCGGPGVGGVDGSPAAGRGRAAGSRRRDQRAGAVGRVGVEAGVDDIDASRLE